MTTKKIFEEWSKDLPYRRKIQLAEEILLISGDTDLTPEEQKILREAKKFLLEE